MDQSSDDNKRFYSFIRIFVVDADKKEWLIAAAYQNGNHTDSYVAFSVGEHIKILENEQELDRWIGNIRRTGKLNQLITTGAFEYDVVVTPNYRNRIYAKFLQDALGIVNLSNEAVI